MTLEIPFLIENLSQVIQNLIRESLIPEASLPEKLRRSRSRYSIKTFMFSLATLYQLEYCQNIHKCQHAIKGLYCFQFISLSYHDHKYLIYV